MFSRLVLNFQRMGRSSRLYDMVESSDPLFVPRMTVPPFGRHEILPVQKSNRLASLRAFSKMYLSKEDRFRGGFEEYWSLHLAQFLGACGDYEVFARDMGNLLAIGIKARCTSHFYGVVP